MSKLTLSDVMEKLHPEKQSFATRDILETFERNILDRRVDARTRPEKRLQAQILSEMMGIDPERAIVTMKAWATFVQLASRARSAPIKTLAEYIPARVIDAGELIWFGTLTFGMALTIPEDEYRQCMELARPGYIVLGLTNDVYSWEKERAAAEKAGQDHVFNAVWVVMKERSVGEAEAKQICRDEIGHYLRAFCSVVDNTNKDCSLSKDTRAYIEAVKWSCSGNLVWSIYCPRYNDWE
uniref:Terpene synthase metal-binding domain-containing protein n=1 Tax=Photinus pyralis TaxID=7054 RepID=A0A1Y1MMD3_PHOPY